MNPYNKLTRGVGLYTGAFAPAESPTTTTAPDSPITGTSWQDVAKVLTKTTVAVAQKTGLLPAKPAGSDQPVQPAPPYTQQPLQKAAGISLGVLAVAGIAAFMFLRK